MKKALKIIAGFIVVIVIAMVASYQIVINNREVLTDEVRKSLPGKFIKLTDGTVCYDWKGPADGNIVVLVHGLSTPKFVFDGNVDALVAAGHRVLVYDHLGRGFSDRPDIKYDRDLYVRELKELMDGLDIQNPVDLVGYSMGGGNVVGFAARYPDRVKKLVLIAPAGFIPEYSGLASLVLVPGLGDWLMTMLGKATLVKGLKQEVDAGNTRPEMLTKFEEQFKYRGYLPAVLSTMRHYPMHDLSEDYEAVGRTDIPTWAIWGTEDKVVPFDGSKQVKNAIPQTQVIPVAGAAHSVTYARTKMVNRILIDILQ